jgi:ubiquinone/menaquinone biosynthesis C-methylase UbiE
VTPPSAAPIEQTFAGLGAARVLAVATQLRVFTHLAQGARTAVQVAAAAEASVRGVRMLLDALVGLQFLAREPDGYELLPVSREYLVQGRPLYMGRLLEEDWIWESWGHLAEAVRTGRPFRHVDTPNGDAARFFKALIPSLHVANQAGARRAADVLLGDGMPREGLDVLDVGCGSAVWSIALVEAAGAAVRVTAQDLPSVLELTRDYLRIHGVERQYDFLPGDQRRVDFGTARYDVAVIARYVHELGADAARDLFRRVCRALRPGGRIVVADWMPNDDRTGPPGPLLYALRMLLHTEQGDAHTAADYRRWLSECGYRDLRLVTSAGSDVPLVIATRPASAAASVAAGERVAVAP